MKKLISIFAILFTLTASAQIDVRVTTTQIYVPDIHLSGYVKNGVQDREFIVEVFVYDSATGVKIKSLGADVFRDTMNNIKYDSYVDGKSILTAYFAKRGMSVPPALMDNVWYNSPPYDFPRQNKFSIPVKK